WRTGHSPTSTSDSDVVRSTLEVATLAALFEEDMRYGVAAMPTAGAFVSGGPVEVSLTFMIIVAAGNFISGMGTIIAWRALRDTQHTREHARKKREQRERHDRNKPYLEMARGGLDQLSSVCDASKRRLLSDSEMEQFKLRDVESTFRQVVGWITGLKVEL